jgi:hypothetical protein
MRLSVARVGVIAGALFSTVAAAQPSTNSSANWVSAGPVHALARTGNTVYIGGQFNGVSPRVNRLAPSAFSKTTSGDAPVMFFPSQVT